jgi:Na+/melibiose symporter-like transporter
MMGAAIASAIGGALLSYLLEWAGYTKEMTEATPKLIQAIDISFIWIPLACWLVLGFIFYSWKKQNKELDSFRKADENYKPL